MQAAAVQGSQVMLAESLQTEGQARAMLADKEQQFLSEL